MTSLLPLWPHWGHGIQYATEWCFGCDNFWAFVILWLLEYRHWPLFGASSMGLVAIIEVGMGNASIFKFLFRFICHSISTVP